jgi:hypothetical protein
MDRVAVFVDAGRLFAQGSAALLGSKFTRELLALDAPMLVARLRDFATARIAIPLLRISWYDSIRQDATRPAAPGPNARSGALVREPEYDNSSDTCVIP